MIDVYIDGTQVYPQLPFEWNKDGTEEYDNGQIVLTNLTQKKAFPDYAIVEIDEKRFILAKDYVKRIGKGLYEHTIDLKEEVYILNSIITPDRKFTTKDGTRVTYLYMVEQLLSCYDLNNPSFYVLSTNAQTILNVPADFTELVGGTLLNHLVKIFRAVKCVPTLNDGLIEFNKLGDVGEPISTSLQEKITNDTLQQYQEYSQIDDYGSQVYTKAKNAVYERDEDVVSVFPYKNGFVTPRSSSNKYNDTNAQLECDSKMREVKKLLHYINVEWVSSTGGNFGISNDVPNSGVNGEEWTCQADGYYSNVVQETFNLGDYAVWLYDRWYKIESGFSSTDALFNVVRYSLPKNDWDKLEIETNGNLVQLDLYQNNTIYHQDDKFLNLGVEYDTQFLTTEVLAYDIMIKSYLDNADNGTENITVGNRIDIVETQWYWEYTAKRDVDFIQGRASSSKVTKDITIFNQQSDSEVELSRLGQASFSKVNRIGNDKFQITVLYTALADIEDIFNYDDNGYTITQIKILARANDFTAQYEFVKNNAPLKINEATTNPISRYTITDRQVQTNFIKRYHILVSPTTYTQDSELPSDFNSRLLNLYDYESAYDKPINTAVYESATITQDIAMSVQKSVEANVISLHSQFQSPTVAGAQLVATGFNDLAHKRTNINYTDEYGQVDGYKLHFCNEIVSDPDDFPVVTSYTRLLGNVGRAIELQPDEILADTTCIDVQSDLDNLYIYTSLLQENSLIKEIGSGGSITVLYYDKHNLYNANTTEANSADVVGIGSLTVDKTNGVFNITVPSGKSWAIRVDGNLHMAFNYRGNDITQLKFNKVKINPNLEE